jgi:hypothetical protein
LEFKVQNPGAGVESFQVWLDGYDELGNPDPNNPLFGPVDMELAAADGVRGGRGYLVPADTPPGGAYQLCLRVGQHPGEILDQDCLRYAVLPGLSPQP